MKMRESSYLTFPSILFLLLGLGLILVAVGADSSSSSNSTSDADLREEFKRLKDLVEVLREQVQTQKNENEQLTSALTSPAQWTSEPLKGVPGPKGQRGERGDAGFPGRDGEDAEKGDRGIQGRDGTQGIPGEKGEIGAVGPRGERGERGLPGDRGSSGNSRPEFPNFCTTTQHRYWASSSSLSISYPRSGQYGNNLDVCFLVVPPPGGRAIITVTKVKTETTHDHLEIYKSTSGSLATLGRLTGDLGSSLQTTFSSNTDEPLLLHFHSDSSATNEGISFLFEAR